MKLKVAQRLHRGGFRLLFSSTTTFGEKISIYNLVWRRGTGRARSIDHSKEFEVQAWYKDMGGTLLQE